MVLPGPEKLADGISEMHSEEKKANFIGHWAPTLLIFGLYNKMVKLHGSDSLDRSHQN